MDLKEQIIQEYLTQGCGFRKLADKYGISRTTICKWVLIYQGIHNLPPTQKQQSYCSSSMNSSTKKSSSENEQPHFNATSFRVNGKIFASLEIDKQKACLKFSPDGQQQFCSFDKAIYPVDNHWGKSGWTYIDIYKIREDLFDANTQGLAPGGTKCQESEIFGIWARISQSHIV